jgi:hypothetical protein
MALVLGPKKSKVAYLNERCSLVAGKTADEAIGMMVPDSKGGKSKYSNGDLQYDIKSGRLAGFDGAAKAKVKSEPAARTKRPATSLEKNSSKKTKSADQPKSPTKAKGAVTLVEVGPLTHEAPASTRSCTKLNDGNLLPWIGLGTYKLKAKDGCKRLVTAALQQGYRAIDTAFIYDNEKDVGAAIAASGVPREQIVVTTKQWRKFHGYEATKKNLRTSLRYLGLDQLDLWLMHWPGPGYWALGKSKGALPHCQRCAFACPFACVFARAFACVFACASSIYAPRSLLSAFLTPSPLRPLLSAFLRRDS